MMDAVEFLDKIDRLSQIGSTGEKIRYTDYRTAGDNTGAVKFVEQWAAEHPAKTRQSVFLEQYPETEIDKYGCLRLCPELVSADYRNRHGDCINRVCIDCRREFWMQEVENAEAK